MMCENVMDGERKLESFRELSSGREKVCSVNSIKRIGLYS